MATFVEKMLIVIIFALCSSAVGSSPDEVLLHPDVAFLSVAVSETAELICCFTPNGKLLHYTWIRIFNDNTDLMSNVSATQSANSSHFSLTCDKLIINSVDIKDSGLYQCHLTGTEVNLYTPGTYLQVYEPLAKTINISEVTKNWILAAEGILLLLCVLLPSASLLFKSKRVKSLEKKLAVKEEENIYQGLNLDDCCSTYDQIERSQGPYQDVCNVAEEEKDIQLEKP